MKKICFTIIVLMALSGCASVQGWKYTAEPKIYKKQDLNLTIAVPSLRDERINENNAFKASGWLALIPLVPYSTQSEFNVPEASPFLNFKPTEDFSKAITEELQNSSIFKEVYYSDRTKDADLILSGTLKESHIKKSWTFYGLSLPGDLLWLFGAPTGWVNNDIVIEYKLMDQNYKIYFEKTYTANVEFYNRYWTNPHEIFRFESTLKKISLELVDDIKAIIQQLPKNL